MGQSHPGEKHPETRTLAGGSDRRGIELSVGNRLKILPAEKISVRDPEEKQI